MENRIVRIARETMQGGESRIIIHVDGYKFRAELSMTSEEKMKLVKLLMDGPCPQVNVVAQVKE